MRAEQRDKLIERIDQAAQRFGAADFADGVRQASQFLETWLARFALVKTKDDLKKLLDEMPDPSLLEEKLILSLLRYLPQILRVWAKRLAEQAEEDFPAAPGGRPSTDLRERAEIVAYIGKLHLQGCSLELSKKRTATRFGRSESTIQRIWDNRGSIQPADFRSALKWVMEGAF